MLYLYRKNLRLEGITMSVSFLIVTLAAFITPMVLARFKVSFLPTSVAEIIIGIIIGKSCFNLIHADTLLSWCSTFGVILLMFLSGMEIDFSLFKKNSHTLSPLEAKMAANEPKTSPVRAATYAYAFSLVASLILALLFKVTGLFSDVGLATILFSTVSLGIMTSLLKENELLSRPFGQTILLFSVLGEVIPMIALTAYSSIYAGKGASLWLITLLFIAAAFLFNRFRHFFSFFDKINKATTQIDMRLAFFVIIALVLVAETVGAENILGAFVAGIVLKLLEPAEETEHRLDAIGYGFFTPFFFILTGVNLDIPSLMRSPKTLLLIPLFFVAFILAKLPGYFGFQRRFSKKNSFVGAVAISTTITLVVTTLKIAEHLHAITPQQSGAFLLAGILTCIVGPVFFNKQYKPEPEDQKQTSLHIIGVNLVTVSAAQQLSKGMYDVQMYTDNSKNFTTYNSQANVHFLDSLDPDELIANHIFDTDILVLGYADYNVNYKLSLAAKKYGVNRVIVRFENRNPLNDMENELKKAGIEYFSYFDINVGMMRSMIDSPSMLQILTSSESRLYEVVVNDSIFVGVEVKDLPHIDKITISRIYRNGHAVAPHGYTQLQLGDHIIFSASAEESAYFRRKLQRRNE